MRVFYGGAIQGAKNRKQRSKVNLELIRKIKQLGYEVVTEHTSSTNYNEAMKQLEQAIGPIPKEGLLRRQYIRNKMIEFVEGDISAAIFELSMPSLGTGIEFAHAYLRPRLGIETIPVLGLYQKDFWPNNLSTMIRGISNESVPQVTIYDYTDISDAKQFLETYFKRLEKESSL